VKRKALRKTEFSELFVFASFGIVRLSKFGKNPVFEAKIWVLGSKTGVSKHSEFIEISEFVLFQTFRKLQKNDIKIEFWKSQKTCSNSNSY